MIEKDFPNNDFSQEYNLGHHNFHKRGLKSTWMVPHMCGIELVYLCLHVLFTFQVDPAGSGCAAFSRKGNCFVLFFKQSFFSCLILRASVVITYFKFCLYLFG